MVSPAPSRRQRRLGQNFLADTNLLDAIVRESEIGTEDVALEIGAGAGALSARLADASAHLHMIEVDRGLEQDLAPLARRADVTMHWGDAMKLDLGALDPAPSIVVSNLPYSAATPLILRTITDLAGVDRWTVMVQREVGERLAASSGSRLYGAPSVLAQLAAEVAVTRRVPAEVFVPRPRVDSALLRLRRIGPAAPANVRELVRAAFAHRRKSLPRSVELAGAGRLENVRAALRALGLREDARAESLTPTQFAALADKLADAGPG